MTTDMFQTCMKSRMLLLTRSQGYNQPHADMHCCYRQNQ